ncbi:MAG: tetratricopeptide repeat protein, partial [Desulfatiglandales bacterium]
FFKKRLLPASLYMSKEPFSPFLSKGLRMRAERIILELKGEEDPVGKVLRSIWAHGVFDRCLDRLEEAKDSEIDDICPSHIVLDEKRLSLYGCWRDFAQKRPVTSGKKGVLIGHDVLEVLMKKRYQEGCRTCVNSALMEMGPALEINQREQEAVRVFAARSNFLIRRGDHMKAAAFLSHAIESEKDEEKNASLCTQMGICYLNAGDSQSAFEALSRARDLGSNSGLTLYYLGLCQFHLKDYIEATDLFDQARLKDVAPEILRDLYFYKGVCHILLEEFDEAIHSMEEAEEAGASKVPVFFYRGMGHLGKEEITKAIHFFHKALKADPTPEDQGRIIFYIGVCNKEQHRHREAIVWLQKAGDIEGPSQEIYNLMGFCHFKLKQHALAISCFEKAIEIDPKSAIDYANIGSNLRKLGRIQEAIHMYRESLAIDPSIRFARENLIELEKMENKRTRTSLE